MESAGVRLGDADPFAVTIMDEIGIDISAHKPKVIEDLYDLSFDLIVTLAPKRSTRRWNCCGATPLMWSTGQPADPTLSTGSRDQILGLSRGPRPALCPD